MGRLDGKVALITGGARGMGSAHAITLAREGADIVIVDIVEQLATVPYEMSRPDDLESTVAEIEALDRRVIALRGDVRKQGDLDAAVTRAIGELGKIDIAVANAGIWSMAPFWELSDEQWQEMVDVNLTGVWRTAKAVAPHMISRREGAIVMISSANGLEAAHDFAHYVAAKHGVIGLMRAVALELGPYGIRCNAICPGTIDTKISDWQGAYDMMAGHPGGTPEDRIEGARHWALLAGRSMLKPTAVSSAVLWLVSDDASEVTGVVLPVDAGHMALPGFNPSPVRTV